MLTTVLLNLQKMSDAQKGRKYSAERVEKMRQGVIAAIERKKQNL